MKIYTPILLLLFSLFTSCTENECCDLPPESDPTLFGEWQLSKICFSNGATRCESEADMWDPDYTQSLTFALDGTYQSETDDVICSGTYEVSVEDSYTVTSDLSSECSFEEFEYRINTLSDTRLIISPLTTICTDGCLTLYVRKR